MSKEETILKTGWDDDSRVMAAVACLKAVDHVHRNDIVDKASDIVALLCADFERGMQQLCADYKPSAWVREIAKGIGDNRARLRRLALTWLTGHFRPLANLFAGHALEVRRSYLGIAIWEAADRYDIDAGVPFRAYLLWRIRNLRWRLRRYVTKGEGEKNSEEGEDADEKDGGELQVNPSRYLYHQFCATGDAVAAHQAWLDVLRREEADNRSGAPVADLLGG